MWRPLRPSAIGTFKASQSMDAWRWQKRSGYTRRSLVEAAISRLKRVIGDALRSRTDRRRATEIAIAVHALNRMLELGRPKSVRIA